MVAPTNASSEPPFTVPSMDEEVTWANNTGLTIKVNAKKKSILLSISFSFRLQRKGLFPN
jgi:hypothetical protein